MLLVCDSQVARSAAVVVLEIDAGTSLNQLLCSGLGVCHRGAHEGGEAAICRLIWCVLSLLDQVFNSGCIVLLSSCMQGKPCHVDRGPVHARSSRRVVIHGPCTNYSRSLLRSVLQPRGFTKRGLFVFCVGVENRHSNWLFVTKQCLATSICNSTSKLSQSTTRKGKKESKRKDEGKSCVAWKPFVPWPPMDWVSV